MRGRKNKNISSDKSSKEDTPKVYDFMYHDARRVASFLAQLDPSGLLTGVKESENSAKEHNETVQLQATANMVIAKTAGNLSKAELSKNGDAIERTYDPLWVNALKLLQFLENRKLIYSDLITTQMGQFVIVRGPLLIADLNLLKGLWEKAYIRDVMTAGVLMQPAVQSLPEEMKKVVLQEFELVFDTVPSMPHSLQARLISETGKLWCALSPEAFVGSPSDITLKYGPLVSGEWNILAVLDAKPYDPNNLTDDGRPFIDFLADIAGAGSGQMSVRLARATQVFLGRPPEYFGGTPLIIYREIS